MKRTIIIRDAEKGEMASPSTSVVKQPQQLGAEPVQDGVPTGVATPIASPNRSAMPSARSHKARAALTILCALTADGLQWILPFLWPVCDAAMVLAILILWGWRWEILVAVIPELIPGLELAPTWTIFAGYIALGHRR